MTTSTKELIKLQVSFILTLVSISFVVFYYHLIREPNSPYIPSIRFTKNKAEPFRKVSIAHYTTTYGSRTDSQSNILNENLKEVCNIVDPEEYSYANSVIVSLVDFVRFPTLSNGDSYKRKHPSQLWLVHTEESPRNSYSTAQINDITDLNDWFNLTTTLRPESDIHIQYKVRCVYSTLSPCFCPESCSSHLLTLMVNIQFFFYIGVSSQTRNSKSHRE